MIVTTSWIEKNYNKFNKKLWEGKLPAIKFKTNRAEHSWGYASFKYDWDNDTIIPEAITISNFYDSPEKVKIQTLLHEMIHIADYTFHPEHFIRNRRKVSARQYNAHGYWFMNEAIRISNLSGYNVTNHVTREEQKISCLSERSKKCLENKKNNAILCVVYGTSGINFYFKTDIYKVNMIKKTIKSYTFYYIGDIKKVKFYTFENERLANMRSCAKRLTGWFADYAKLDKKLRDIKATEVRL